MTTPSQRTDWFERVRRGDRLALAKLLASHYPMLVRRAGARMDRVLQARMEPEDLLQEVYIDAFRQIDGLQDLGENAFTGWLTTILESKIIDAKRALQRRKRDVGREIGAAARGTESYWNLLDQVYAHSETPSRVVRREEAVGALMACVPRLDGGQREVIQLRFMEGQSVREVAERLGKTEGAVVALTRRALESLRGHLDDMGEVTRAF